MMKNYVEKYAPSGEFEKSKVRVLVRGDLQHVIGETEGPVTRVESTFILISIAVYRELDIFKIDITAAYLNTDERRCQAQMVDARQGCGFDAYVYGCRLLEGVST